MKKKPFSIYLLILIVVIAILNMLAVSFSWYWRIWWLDMPMHFLGGLWVGLTSIWIFYNKDTAVNCNENKRNYSHIFFISIASVLLVGILWEIFEFGVNANVSFSIQNSLSDTLSDLFFDLLGAVFSSIYYIKREEK